MAKNNLTCVAVVPNADGTEKKIAKMLPDGELVVHVSDTEFEQFRQKNGERMAKSFQDYYSIHPEEW